MSDSHYPRDPEDEEEEDEVDDSGYKTTKDAVLFAIDVSKSMLTAPSEFNEKKPDTALSPTLAALKCAYALMQQRIISNPNDMMGILLFGTEKSRFQDGGDGEGPGLQYPHCYLLTDLDVPAAANDKTYCRPATTRSAWPTCYSAQIRSSPPRLPISHQDVSSSSLTTTILTVPTRPRTHANLPSFEPRTFTILASQSSCFPSLIRTVGTLSIAASSTMMSSTQVPRTIPTHQHR
jgi:hypothetical protein